jgi:hypothetical protein
MFALAYVLIPSRFTSLQTELDRALAAFRRGGPKEFPPERLAFDDVTDTLRRLHVAHLELERSGSDGVTIRGLDMGDSFALDTLPLQEVMRRRNYRAWSGRLADLEPDFEAFAQRFSAHRERHPVTGGYGQWLNPLGRWDWWDLGGRFDGTISGGRQPGRVSDRHMISSGPNTGRDLVGSVATALGADLSDVEAETEANIEPVEALLAAARQGLSHAFPTTIVLPDGACADELRWLEAGTWHPIPGEAKAFLGQPAEASFKPVATAAYERFAGCAAAGVAYHC